MFSECGWANQVENVLVLPAQSCWELLATGWTKPSEEGPILQPTEGFVLQRGKCESAAAMASFLLFPTGRSRIPVVRAPHPPKVQLLNVRQIGNVLQVLGFSYVKALLTENLELSCQSKCEGQPRQRLLLGPNFLLIVPSSWAAEIHVYLEPKTIWTISPYRPGLGLCLMRMLSAEQRPAVLFP